MNSRSQLIIFGIMLGFISSAFGHSYLTSPISRTNQKQSTTGCRGPSCLGPCDGKAASARSPVTIARGASVSLQWPRNNHAGGFIRVAWAPTAQSDSHDVFDANIQEVVCHERGGCRPDDASNPNGGDSNPADGSYLPCQVTITVPPHLTDGLWTLQWAWFGGAFALGDYYSCVDYKISGGASGSKPDPFFDGGDFTYPGQQKCKFFNTDRLHRCVNEPCNNPVYPLSTEQSGPAFGITQGSIPSVITTGKAQPSTTGKAQPSTTGKAQPSTTGKTQPSTTGKTEPATTGKVKPATTGEVKAATTGEDAPFSVPSDPTIDETSNCIGATQTSISQATIIYVDSWGVNDNARFRAVIDILVQEDLLTDWYLEVVFPTQQKNPTITGVYNAGAFGCQTETHAIITPSNWVTSAEAGTSITIEIQGTNLNNLSHQDILTQTQVFILRK